MAAHALTTPITTPSLRSALVERTAALRSALSRSRAARTPSAPRTMRADLLEAYAAAQAVRPVFEEDIAVDSPRYQAAFGVEKRMRDLVSAVLEGPTPRTADGLGTVALAAAIHAEGLARSTWDNGAELVATARALLVATGTALPAGFLGFGDEPGFEAREVALIAGVAQQSAKSDRAI